MAKKFCPNPKSSVRKGMKAGGNPTINELAQAGAILELIDAAGSPIATQPAPADVTVVWSSSDTSILTVTVDATNSLQATVASTGKPGTATLSASVAFVAGSPGPFMATQPVDVPAGPPVSAIIVLGPPLVPPAPTP